AARGARHPLGHRVRAGHPHLRPPRRRGDDQAPRGRQAGGRGPHPGQPPLLRRRRLRRAGRPVGPAGRAHRALPGDVLRPARAPPGPRRVAGLHQGGRARADRAVVGLRPEAQPAARDAVPARRPRPAGRGAAGGGHPPHARRQRERTAAPMSTTYEVLAIRYGTRPTTRAQTFLNHHVYREPDTPIDLDFFLWVARNDERTVVIDTGYTAASAVNRMPRLELADPIGTLAELGVKPEASPQVIITHAHYDHLGNLDAFPSSEVVLARAEYDFWTGPYA